MNGIKNKGNAPSAIDVAVHRELICILFGTPAVPLINGVAILVTTAVLWRVFPRWISLSWLIAALCVVLSRVILWAEYNKRRSEVGRNNQWARLFTIATVVIGLLWGLIAATVLVSHDPIDAFFATFIVAGLSAGAAIRNSAHPPALYAFIGTAVPPMVLALFLRGRLVYFAMGCMLLVFIVVMILIGRENYQRLADFIRIKIEQEVLNENLQTVTRDLTEQNAVLRERSELLDNAQDAIYVLDLGGRILYWNKGAERMFGWTQKEVIGREVVDVFPEIREMIRKTLQQVAEQGRWSGEVTKRDKHGSWLTVASRCTLVGNSDGRPRSIFIINTDVTEQKASRARIHRLAYYDAVTGLPNRGCFGNSFRTPCTHRASPVKPVHCCSLTWTISKP